MKMRSLLSAIAVFGLALPAFAQEGKKPQPTPAGKPVPTSPVGKPVLVKPEGTQPAKPDLAQVEMMKAAAPGDNHRILNGMIGTWSAACKFWMDPTPGSAPTESTGTVVNTGQLEGRWVRMEFKGQFDMEMNGQKMKMPFSGLGYMGYDNVDKHYHATWMDTLTTGLLHTHGSYDAAKKIFTMTGEFKDPMSGQSVTERDVTTLVDSSTMKFEMFKTDAQGKEHRVGEIVYTRNAAQDTAAPTKITPKTTEKK